jgi:hypothetical protein
MSSVVIEHEQEAAANAISAAPRIIEVPLPREQSPGGSN